MVDKINCPARQGLLPDTDRGCFCQIINENKGVVQLNKQTPWNTTYFASDKNNCCNGYAKPKPGFLRGFPTNQNGRWNCSLTNTKMYPFRGLQVRNRLPTCPKSGSSCYNGTYGVTGGQQSRNIFPNTHKMSQKKLFSYLSNHRAYLRR